MDVIEIKLEEEHTAPKGFTLKDIVIGYSSLILICSTILLVLTVNGILPIESLFSTEHPYKGIIISVLSIIGLVLYGILLNHYIPSDKLDNTNKTYQDFSLFKILVFMLLVAVFEELLFRGIIQSIAFLLIDNKWIALVIATILFVLFHFNYFKNPIMLLNITLPGVVFGWLYFETFNILVPIFVHFLVNVIMTILYKFDLIRLKQ